MRAVLTSLILLGTLLLVPGCSSESAVDISDAAGAGAKAGDAGTGTDAGPDSTNSDQTEGQRVIGYSAMSLANPFFSVIADNLRSEAVKHGFDVVVDDADGDFKTQSEQIESYVARGFTAIVINPVDRLSVGPAIKKANDAGIPVFTCDLQSVAPEGKVTAHVGTDNFQGGRLAGDAMIEVLGESGGKVLVLHYEQAHSCVLRVDGFMEVINAHNEGRESGKIDVVSTLDGGGSLDIGRDATAAAIQTDSDLSAIFAINDPSALGAHRALEQAGKAGDVTIIAFDGQIDGKRAIRDGKIYADPIQFPDQMGQLTVQRIVAYLNGEEFEQITLIPTVLYRKADADKDPELSEPAANE